MSSLAEKGKDTMGVCLNWSKFKGNEKNECFFFYKFN